jgi:hypothetical protein
MRNGGGARRRIDPASVVLAALASVIGCSSNSLPISGSRGTGGGAAATGGSAAGTGGSAAGSGGDVSDASADRSDAGSTTGDALTGDASPDGGPLSGMVSIEVNPPSQTVALSVAGISLTGSAVFTATGHFGDGHTEDVTTRVSWPSDFDSLHITAGAANVSAPGRYTVVATSGTVLGTATLVATFAGNRLGPGFDPSGAAILDGTPADATTIAYPLDHAIVPPNLSPLPVHIARISGQTAARLRFTSGTLLDVTYYALCQAGAGTGCYIDVAQDLTRLFIAASETADITLTVRVSGLGAPLSESSPIHLAWANVPLSGALYYWTPLALGIFPGYIPPNNADNTPATSGAGVLRYDFGNAGSALPQLVYTDRGRAPTFLGSPPATADAAQCIGCHAVSGDGKTMALTVGASGAADFALLDLTTLTMTVLDAAASAGVVSMNDINYYKQFRRSGIATETAFGPRGDVMVNMYKSKLFLRGTTASLINQGEVAPNFPDAYKTDPFWSQSGKYFAFTSFAVPDVAAQYYNPTGLNGDMKRGGQIAIASATATGINDDAHVLVPRENNVTKYYPAISDDDALLIYNQSICGVDPDVYTNLAGSPPVGVYGAQTCDGYDDSSATLWLTSPTGAVPVRLDNANGGPTVTYANARPQWSPRNGKFRGERLYWVVFSSRRPFGLQVNNGAPLTTHPQLWLSAVLVGPELTLDPSSSPVWLPNQNATPGGTLPNQVPTGNHTPQWVPVAVPLPG